MTMVYSHNDLKYSAWDAEFDTVIGRKGGKAILTIVLPQSSILIARLLNKKTQDCVCDEFDKLEKIMKGNREKCIGDGGIWWFFDTMLTDRGSEMSDYKRLVKSLYPIETPEECDGLCCRAPVFYCDPYSSFQKPHVEQMHTLLRRVLPKGTWFDDLRQSDINLVCSHINSYAREEMGGTAPFEVAPPGFTDKLVRALGMVRIHPDDITLKPSLLNR